MKIIVEQVSKALLEIRNRHFIILDTIVFSIAPILALSLRLDELNIIETLNTYGLQLAIVSTVFIIVKLSILYSFGFYRRCWRYASIDELTQIVMLTLAAIVLETIIVYTFNNWSNFSAVLPRSLALLDGMLSLIFVGGLRLSIRVVERANYRQAQPKSSERLLIVGAGNAGVTIAQQMQQNPHFNLYPIAFIDDDPAKFQLRIRSLPVVGDRHQIPKIVRSLRVDRVAIAMPSAPGEVIREILDICQSSGVRTSTLPSVSEIVNGFNGRVAIESIREIKIEDLLRREPIQTDGQKVSQLLTGKKVLITGAGGSIGSELCRQVFRCRPAEIMLVGHGENSVFYIQQELERVMEVLRQDGAMQGYMPRLRAFIADIRFPSRLEYAFDQFRPDIVFHAAAHKHVPLMEVNSPEAITNNVLGTKNLLDLALRYDVNQFVMISTDKAVNPTNIMGASKRTAEMLVLQAAQKSGKPYVVVRFGNVLGSRGSVVPTFKQQIAKGGPITVTHPDIRRYFMTIPEAVQLVLQAAVVGCGGAILMLDMGQPVKIVDLAKDLIRLSGLQVDKDIKIQFTGLRPGEKLFEELFIPGEQYEKTEHEKILIVKNASNFTPKTLNSLVEALCDAARQNDAPAIAFLLQQLVPEYKPQNSPIPKQLPASQEKLLDELIVPRSKRQHILDTPIAALDRQSKIQLQEIEQAFEQGEFEIHYQPIVVLQTNRIVGFEALLRWQHPTQGIVSPTDFISALEATDAISTIGWWSLRQACQQLRLWQECYPNIPLTVSVNLSSTQFAHPNLVAQLGLVLEQTGLNPRNLRLEIPESAILSDIEFANQRVIELKALNVELQIDNLGIGYSFLSLLQRLPNRMCYEKFDRLSVDRSLVNQIDTDEESLEILRTIVAISRNLGVETTVTGVETAAQLAQLNALECQYGQGYFFAKPINKDAASTLINSQLQPL
jgi:FlaA1/EpsC-like NDP-sugar epimerase/EAL domain-containing protein (putative c-di-GMP-specific phosphodiesterase class I)